MSQTSESLFYQLLAHGSPCHSLEGISALLEPSHSRRESPVLHEGGTKDLCEGSAFFCTAPPN